MTIFIALTIFPNIFNFVLGLTFIIILVFYTRCQMATLIFLNDLIEGRVNVFVFSTCKLHIQISVLCGCLEYCFAGKDRIFGDKIK